MVMKEYVKRIEASKIMSQMIPKKFENDDDVKLLCSNLNYCKSGHDLARLTKVSLKNDFVVGESSSYFNR